MVNVNQVFTELKKRGKAFTYVKVKCAIEGVPNTTSQKEKKELLAVVDQHYNEVKQNILKS